MDHNAPGQLLGYTVQFPRGLYHLLQCGDSDCVCIEVLGDVASIKNDGSVIVEESKSSTSANPVTNKSTDLWKTFYNWIKDIEADKLKIGNTKFLLYTNHEVKRALVNEFHRTSNNDQAKQAINRTKEKLKNVKPSHEIWKYYNYCVNEKADLFAKVIESFELQAMRSESEFDSVRKEIRKKFVPESQVEFFLQNISGWLQITVVEKIKSKQPAIITWNEFDTKFRMLFERTRKRELIDFTLEAPLAESDLKKALKTRPCYVRQLDKINSSEDEVLEAVTDYLKAKVNRGKWIELEIIDQDIAADFETKLSKFWENRKMKIELTQKELSDEERGKLLLIDCKTRQETIRDMTPPATTIAGTYHVLADGPILGWHKDWEKEFKLNE